MHLSNIQARSARAHLGLEQQDIQKATGISKNQLSRFELGKASLSSKNIQKLTDFFAQRQIEFLENDGIRKKPSLEHKSFSGDEGLRMLFEDIYQATKKTREQVMIYNGMPFELKKHLGDEWYQSHAARMMKLGCSVKAIIKYGDTNFIGNRFAEYKWLPEDQFRDKTIYVYDHKVAYIDFAEEVKILLIAQQDIADSQRILFNNVWDNSAKEIPPDVH